MAVAGVLPFWSAAEAFAARVKSESAMWEKVIRTAKIGSDH